MIKVTVPGVNKILGTFTTCTKGPAVCIVDRRKIEVSFEERNDSMVRACLVKTGECKKLQLGTIKTKKDDKWFNAVKGVYIVLQQQFKTLPAYDITIDGDLIDCDGHVVLSAIAVAVAKVLGKRMKLECDIDSVAKLANEALKAVSENGNMSDIITMLVNDPGKFVVYDGLKKKYSVIDSPFKGSGYSLLLLDGHVPIAALKDDAIAYSKEISSTWNAYYSKFSCHFIDFSDAEFAEMLVDFNEGEKTICRYLYEEHKAAVNIEDILRNKDIPAFAKALDRVRISTSENLDVAFPEMEWVVKRACEIKGCVGSCIFFEGYTTKAAVVIKNDMIDQLRSHGVDYEHIFGFKLSAIVIGDYKEK